MLGDSWSSAMALTRARVVSDARLSLPHGAELLSAWLDRSHEWTMARAARLGSVRLLQRLQTLDRCGGMADFRDPLVVQAAAEEAVAAGHVAVLEWFQRGPGHAVLSSRACAESLLAAATSTAQLAVLRWLALRWPPREICSRSSEALGRVAALGSLECVQWLMEWTPCEPDKILVVMEEAASHGHLHVVEWLQFSHVATVSADSFRSSVKLSRAARRGYLVVLQWFQTHRPDDIRGYLLADAAAGGALDVLQWLHSLNTPSTGNALASIFALSSAAINGHLAIVQWLLVHRSEEFPGSSLHDVARNGHLHVLQWLYDHPQCRELFLDGKMSFIGDAAEGGHLEIIKWLHTVQPKDAVAWRPIDVAAANGHLKVVQWLHQHRLDGCCARAMDLAATNGHLAVVQFLHHNRREGCTTDAMDGAARNGHLEVVQFLHEHRSEGCTYHAMDDAAAANHFDIVVFLHTNRQEGCTTQTMNYAARYGNLEILQFLYDHRSEGCDAKALGLAVSAARCLRTVQWLLDHYPSRFRREEPLCAILERHAQWTMGIRHIIIFLTAVYNEVSQSNVEERRAPKRIRQTV